MAKRKYAALIKTLHKNTNVITKRFKVEFFEIKYNFRVLPYLQFKIRK